MQQALYFWVFPNLMLNIYPDNSSTNVIVPLSHEKTLTIFEWFFHDVASENQKRIKRSVAFSDEVQKEDIGLCENVQRGLRSSTYDRGRYSVKRENGVYHFHMLLGEFLGQPRSEEHTSELQSQSNLVCRLLLEKKKTTNKPKQRTH